MSGVTAVDPEKGVPTGSVEEQAERILNTIATILEAGGSSMDKVLKCTVFLNDVEDFAKRKILEDMLDNECRCGSW